MDTAKKKSVKKPAKKQAETEEKKLVGKGPFVFRCDDVTNFSNMKLLELMRRYLVMRFGDDTRFMAAISLFGRRNLAGSVYPEAPFRGKPFDFFMNVDSFFSRMRWTDALVASHGLFHVDHTKLSEDALKMSIVASCNYLRTRIFVPPFNLSTPEMAEFCKNRGIHLVDFKEGWRSLEHEPFDPAHKLWYFHHWKYRTIDQFAALFGNGKKAEVQAAAPAGDPRDNDKWWESGSYPEYEMTPDENEKSTDPKRLAAAQGEQRQGGK